MSKQQNKRKRYDFTLCSDKSKQDVIAYFKKHGWTETLTRLRETLGPERLISLDQITCYSFTRYKGTVVLYEDKKHPSVKKLAIND